MLQVKWAIICLLVSLIVRRCQLHVVIGNYMFTSYRLRLVKYRLSPEDYAEAQDIAPSQGLSYSLFDAELWKSSSF